MLSTPMRVLWTIGVGLAVLTLIEFIIAVETSNNLIPLTVIALFKAWLIVHFYMHVYRLWRSEGDH
jgi:hypothetical protein